MYEGRYIAPIDLEGLEFTGMHGVRAFLKQ
jgi:hypothetical protein